MMKLRIVMDDKVLLGTILPKWYGIAYRYEECRRTILYIIPLNLLVRYTVQFYWWFYRWLKHDGWKSKQDDIYWRGWNDGRKETDAHSRH